MRIRVSPGRERLAAMILGVVLGALFLGSAALWYAPVGRPTSTCCRQAEPAPTCCRQAEPARTCCRRIAHEPSRHKLERLGSSNPQASLRIAGQRCRLPPAAAAQ